ncbi:hypothetical protein MKJ04_16380 [Pontibacter sp. E15-1]|uniref:hypothetical protein n=1 Tax=Pontibacter sp. E15-1 TaxID=2919918 RepID=UPI001F4FD562|nr:hypothetical protein [Pontibacter sp. E15-1]MCJ8166423.1 hypothetical protein [Pontibacter sp. E15-1]
MILNLSYSEEDALAFVSKVEDNSDIIDVTGVLNPSMTQHKLCSLRQLEGALRVEENAIKKYITYCSQLSKTRVSGDVTVRDLQVSNFPLYWGTDVSVKHYELHWLSAIFLLKESLASGLINLDPHEKHIVILPKGSLHAKIFLIDIFNGHDLKEPRIISRGVNNEILILALFFKNILFNIIGFFRLKILLAKIGLNSEKLEISNFIIANIYASVWPTDKWENYWEAYFGYFNSKTKAWIVPLFNSYRSAYTYNFEKVPSEFIKSSPSCKSVVLICFNISLSYLKSFFYFKNQHTFIGKEIRRSLLNSGFLFSHKWFANFADSAKNTKTVVTYDEEFYPSGRYISHALSLKRSTSDIKYFGLQHGIFFNPSHTVYTLTDAEITPLKNGDGLPLPQKFLVWSDYFKKTFLSNNSIPDDFVLPLGSIKHILSPQVKAPICRDDGPINILWCTTLQHFAKLEYGYFRKGIEKYADRAHLIIRKHPGNHISNTFLLDLLEKSGIKNYSFSENKNILDDIVNADIVLSTSYSTTFIDAMFLGKPSIRFYNYASYPVLTDIGAGSVMVFSEQEFMGAISNYMDTGKMLEYSPNNLSDFVYNDIELWDQLVLSNLSA